MSRHWNPQDELARETRVKHAWPAGATAGIVLVAAACFGVVATLYWVAGPRDVFENDVAVDWNDLPASPEGH